MNKQTVMISGAGGLLGTELIAQLLKNDKFNVVAMTSQKDNLLTKYKDTKVQVVSNELWTKELGDVQIDTLINCAFPRSSKPEELAQGIPFTEKIVNESIKHGITNIINISSQSVYTQKDKPLVTEESFVKPESLYGMTKYACERIVTLICEANDVNYTNIRLASLTGIDFDVRMTNKFVQSVIKGETITIQGGNQKISYLDVRDAAAALIKLISKNTSNWEPIYNLGNNESFTLLNLVENIKEIAIKYKFNVEVFIEEGSENFNNLIDSNLLYKYINFEPIYDLEKMIIEQFEKNVYKGG